MGVEEGAEVLMDGVVLVGPHMGLESGDFKGQAPAGRLGGGSYPRRGGRVPRAARSRTPPSARLASTRPAPKVAAAPRRSHSRPASALAASSETPHTRLNMP